MSSEAKNVCLKCGRDCTFLSTCEGLCLPCGDAMQGWDKVQLIRLLVAAQREVNRLQVAVAEEREACLAVVSLYEGACDPFDVVREIAERIRARDSS